MFSALCRVEDVRRPDTYAVSYSNHNSQRGGGRSALNSQCHDTVIG